MLKHAFSVIQILILSALEYFLSQFQDTVRVIVSNNAVNLVKVLLILEFFKFLL